ncbi:MAG TPA: hypothetical protein VIJ93_04455, partial [bacterium]
DAIFYLNVSPKILAERNFQKRGFLDYWESGMDIQRMGGMYENFAKYQGRLHKVFETLQKEFSFHSIQGSRSPVSIAKEIRVRVEKILSSAEKGEKATPVKEAVPPPEKEKAPSVPETANEVPKEK